jgi:AcrR family transcriptional regulator
LSLKSRFALIFSSTTAKQNDIMLKSKEHQKSWLSVGYKLFGEDGPEGIQVERLARILQLNKSSFYHFFVNKEIFINQMLQMHERIANELTEEIFKLESFDPGLINLLMEYKDTVLFHRQLIRNSQFPDYKKIFDDINHKIDRAVLPLWQDEVNLSKESAFTLFEMIRDTFYSRMNPKNMSADTIRSVVNESKLFLFQMQKDGKLPK